MFRPVFKKKRFDFLKLVSFFRYGVKKEYERKNIASVFSSVIVKFANWKSTFEDKQREKQKNIKKVFFL